eukprot:CAMPEP_0117456404 /NCGR_PEP_ID=MMETSP0759-20121206/11859_1 /TAXON_ID=63605 /ORGANISM="Percolomonas cosmopolitus, Strain WS" /LENGTH=1145 /DNA_ID=CAMNT_0005249741 /DNA_START=8 /DNA_END=3444 /DNA_ORIENTATION=-
MSSFQQHHQALTQSLDNSLGQIPSEYKKDSFSHIPIVAKSLSDPQKKLQKLDQYISILEDSVDEITNVHYREFNQSIRNFSRSVDKVDDCCVRVNQMVLDLDRCESLLQSRADDLSQLYGSYLQHSECLRILKMIEEVREVPKSLRKAIDTKHYLYAAEQVIKYTECLRKEELNGVRGLVDIRSEIDSFRDKLPEVLVQELNAFCYSTTSCINGSTSNQLNSDRNAAGNRRSSGETDVSNGLADSVVGTHMSDTRDSYDDDASPVSTTDDFTQSSGGDRVNSLLKEQQASRMRRLSRMSSNASSDTSGRTSGRRIMGPPDDFVIDNDLSSNPQADTSYFISMVIEALDKLNMLQDAQSSLIQDLQENIRQLIENPSPSEFKVQFSESEQYWRLIHSDTTTKDNSKRARQQTEPLKMLLKQLFDKLLVVISNFKYVIQKITRKLSSSASTKSQRKRSISSQMSRSVLTKIKDSIRLKVNALRTEQITNAEKKRSANMIIILEQLSKKLEESQVDGMLVKDIPDMFWNIAKAKLSNKAHHMLDDSDINSYSEEFRAILNEALTSNPKLLTLSHIWNTMQLEVQAILVDLLHARVTHNSDQDKQDISNPNQKLEIRFKFGSNIDANDGSAANPDDRTAQTTNSLCKPLTDVFLFSPYNLIHIYKTLINFMNSAEEVDMSCKSAILVSYIEMEVIPDILMQRVEKDYLGELNDMLDSPESFQPNASLKQIHSLISKDITSIGTLKESTSHLPLLKSVVSLSEWMADLVSYSASMPSHRTDFFNIIDILLRKFYDWCKSKIESSVAGTYAMECLWGPKSEVLDILQKDPAWMKLNHMPTGGSALKVEAQEDAFKQNMNQLVDQPLQERQEISKHLLISNSTDTILLADLMVGLRPKQIAPEEVENTLSKLKDRRRRGAVLHSKKYAKTLNNGTASPSLGSPLSPLSPHHEKRRTSLDKYVNKYIQLAHQTLFALKIDLRARCVIYLLPIREGNYFLEEEVAEPESFIQNFNKDLKRFEECVEMYMPRQKLFYLLHRLSTLIGQIFISSLPKCIQWRFNDKGVKKIQKNIQALQQNLINMIHSHSDTEETLDQDAFAKGHKYYDLLLLAPKEVYQAYVEDVELHEKPTFTLKEYTAVLETETHKHSRDSKY